MGEIRGKSYCFPGVVASYIGKMMKISEDKYSCGRDIRTDVLSGKEKCGYFVNKSQIYKIFTF